MVRTTRAQREALFQILRRDFPSWITVTTRRNLHGDIVKVPSEIYRKLRARVRPGPGCIMINWRGMWLGIEPDGYTHS